MLLVLAGVVALTMLLFVKTPKGYFPADDTGLIWGSTQASTEASFQAMYELQQKATDIVLADPAIAGVGSSIGTSAWNSSVNRGQLFISLKPLSERKGVSDWDVVNRLRPKLTAIPGLRVFMFPMQDVRAGARSADASYQYTLWDPDYHELVDWVQRDQRQARRRCRNWSTSPPTGSRAACRSMSMSTASPRRGSA